MSQESDLVQEADATHNTNVVFFDKVLEAPDTAFANPSTAGFSISQSSFSNVQDRLYDVRGLLGFFLVIINESGVDIEFELFSSRSHKGIENLTAAEFTTEEISLVTVTDGNESTPFEFVRATPMITAYQLKLRRKSGTGPIFVNGIVSAN